MQDPDNVLAKVPSTSEMSNWSETLRNDFCTTFDQRVRVARYLSFQVAHLVWSTAHRRHFVSAKHVRALMQGFAPVSSSTTQYHSDDIRQMLNVSTNLLDKRENSCFDQKVGGRGVEELHLIAENRAEEILKNLPPLAKAVRVIDVATARKIDKKEELLVEGERLRNELEEMNLVFDMSDSAYEDMTIKAFRAMVEKAEEQRNKMVERLNKVSTQGQQLEAEIAKALYAGLPGLSEAVVDVVRSHIEQAIGLEAMGRRVTEHVKFGNSTAAVELLRTFEKDEVTISEDVAARFRTALEQLKVKKPRKEIRGKGGK